VFVVYGKAAFPATVESSLLNGNDGFTIKGIAPGDFLGIVGILGDVN
jgi:hypothetical protein